MSRFVSVHIEHPGARERGQGASSAVKLYVDRGLRSGKLDAVPVSEDDLVRLLAEGARALAVLRGVRVGHGG